MPGCIHRAPLLLQPAAGEPFGRGELSRQGMDGHGLIIRRIGDKLTGR
jgi:hypothetical protein